MIYCVALIPPALLGLAVPYSILRLRNEEPADPQLGIKAAVQYFYSVAILIAMTGLTIVAVDLIAGEAPDFQQNDFNDFDGFGNDFGEAEDGGLSAAKRIGLGMFISGLLIALLNLSFGKNLTTKAHWPRIRRIFAGCRFAVQGIVSMLVFTALMVMILQDGAFEPELFRVIKSFLAVLVVWVPAWGLHLYLLMQASEHDPGPPPRPLTTNANVPDTLIDPDRPG
jgi:hypothetical protein